MINDRRAGSGSSRLELKLDHLLLETRTKSQTGNLQKSGIELSGASAESVKLVQCILVDEWFWRASEGLHKLSNEVVSSVFLSPCSLVRTPPPARHKATKIEREPTSKCCTPCGG